MWPSENFPEALLCRNQHGIDQWTRHAGLDTNREYRGSRFS